MFILIIQVFGYVTNTNIKFIVVVDASNATLRDNEIRFVELENGIGANVKKCQCSATTLIQNSS